MKPGMACLWGEKDGKTVYGPSGNPASALTGFYAVVMPVLRKLAGRKDIPEIVVTLADDFTKASRCTRLLRGRLDISDGTAKIRISGKQGNVVISSAIGCDIGYRAGRKRTVKRWDRTERDFIMKKQPFLFAISGVKNSGKTTLITKLIPLFKNTDFVQQLSNMTDMNLRQMYRAQIPIGIYRREPMGLRCFPVRNI